jgi:predicted phosphodiesterase
MKIVWLNDIHLNFLGGEQVCAFLDKLKAKKPDVVLVGGDIGEANDFGLYLQEMAEAVQRPIYFVLGNHDFYHGTFESVHAKADAICRNNPNLHWLSRSGVVKLTDQVALVGHDGWGDGRCGDYVNSPIEMNDFYRIGDFMGLDKAGRLKLLHQLGSAAAKHVRTVLTEALARFEGVILLTHVAPFPEAAWFEGGPSTPDWLPFMACKAVGDVLVQCMQQHPDQMLTVVCGHTHGGGLAVIADNIRVLTGEADYGKAMAQLVRPQSETRVFDICSPTE